MQPLPAPGAGPAVVLGRWPLCALGERCPLFGAALPRPPSPSTLCPCSAGGGHAFKPLVSAVRSLPAGLQLGPLVRAAHQCDRLAVALDTRPQLRLLLMLYFALLHVLVVL